MDQNIQGQDINASPDLSPVGIPDHEMSPSIEDRLANIEEVLHI